MDLYLFDSTANFCIKALTNDAILTITNFENRFENDIEIKVFPNPVNETLFVKNISSTLQNNSFYKKNSLRINKIRRKQTRGTNFCRNWTKFR